MDAETATVLRGRAKAALTRTKNFIDKDDQTFDKNDIRTALHRFSAYRGAHRPIYSDNGTNFVGVRRKLDEIRKLWLSLPTNEAISYYLSKSSIDWHFIPPSSPHFGDNLVALHFKYDQARRRFVEWAPNEIAVVPNFHKRILFSDEAHFWLNGYVNKQKCHIWSEANPQVYVETPLHPENLTVWHAFWAGGIIGPYFFKNDEGHNVTVNGDRYRALITNFFIPELNNHDVRGCGSKKTAQHVTQLVPQSIY
ncbi:uncharacterized protein TNCV_1784531 [Trichonephila clavipes]|nr:uncharacterized protein TNCV_1784531 [Trichonephila clavipes]